MLCTTCGTQRLESSKFCTKCGQQVDAPVMEPGIQSVPQTQENKNKKGWWIITAALFGVIVLTLAAIHSRMFNHAVGAAPAKGYQLNTKESALLDHTFQNEIRVFSIGDQSMLVDINNLVQVSVQNVVNTYEENQAAGDQAYYKKQLYLSGVVASVHSGSKNQSYITLQGPNTLMNPTARFGTSILAALSASVTDPSVTDQRIADLKEGQAIVLVCNGGGLVAGAPTLNDCAFADTYAVAATAKLKKTYLSVLTGDEKASPTVAEYITEMLYAARKLPENSTCYTAASSPDCARDMDLLGKNIDNQAFLQIAKELKAKGVDIPQTVMDEYENAVQK